LFDLGPCGVLVVVRATGPWVGLVLIALGACSSSSTGGNPSNVYCGVISGCAQYKSCCTYGTAQEVCHYEDSSGNVIAQLPPECTPPPYDGGTGDEGSVDGSAEIGATVLAPAANAISIAADGSGVYWTDPVANAVMHVPLGGGTVTTFASGQGVMEGGLAVAGGVVYWTAGGNLLSAPDFGSGGTGPPSVVAATGQSTPASGVFAALMTLLISNGVAYWDDNEVVNDYYQGTIRSVPLSAAGTDGGLPQPASLQSPGQQISGLVTDGASMYWIENGTLLNNFFDGSIDAAPLSGGAALALAGSDVFTPPAALAVAGSNVYWSTEAIGTRPITIMAVPVAGGASSTFATLASMAWPMVADDANLYFSQHGTIVKMPLSGGAQITLAQVQPAPDCMAVDADNIYLGSYVSGGGGNVLAVAK
jgi:hypothetical protein